MSDFVFVQSQYYQFFVALLSQNIRVFVHPIDWSHSIILSLSSNKEFLFIYFILAGSTADVYIRLIEIKLLDGIRKLRLGCLKTKTKVITLANYNGRKYCTESIGEPI